MIEDIEDIDDLVRVAREHIPQVRATIEEFDRMILAPLKSEVGEKELRQFRRLKTFAEFKNNWRIRGYFKVSDLDPVQQRLIGGLFELESVTAKAIGQLYIALRDNVQSPDALALVWIDTCINALQFPGHSTTEDLEQGYKQRIVATAGLWMLIQNQHDGLYEYICEQHVGGLRIDALSLRQSLSFSCPDPDRLDIAATRIDEYRNGIQHPKTLDPCNKQSSTLDEQRAQKTAKSYKRAAAAALTALYSLPAMKRLKHDVAKQVLRTARKTITYTVSALSSITEQAKGKALDKQLTQLWVLRTLADMLDEQILEEAHTLHKKKYSYELLALSLNISKQYLYDELKHFEPPIRWIIFDVHNLATTVDRAVISQAEAPNMQRRAAKTPNAELIQYIETARTIQTHPMHRQVNHLMNKLSDDVYLSVVDTGKVFRASVRRQTQSATPIDEYLLELVLTQAVREIIGSDIAKKVDTAMVNGKTKTDIAKALRTSRSQLDRTIC